MRTSTFGAYALAALLLVGAGCASTEPAPVEQGMPVPGSQTPEMEVNGAAGTQLEGSTPVNDTPDADVNVEPTSAAPEAVPAAQAAEPTGATKAFTVVGDNYEFSLKQMKVKKGDKVRVTFKNAEGFHDFRLDEFTVATSKLQAGGEEVVEFIADKAGTFEYYCSVGKHRAMGMKGNLIVE